MTFAWVADTTNRDQSLAEQWEPFNPDKYYSPEKDLKDLEWSIHKRRRAEGCAYLAQRAWQRRGGKKQQGQCIFVHAWDVREYDYDGTRDVTLVYRLDCVSYLDYGLFFLHLGAIKVDNIWGAWTVIKFSHTDQMCIPWRDAADWPSVINNGVQSTFPSLAEKLQKYRWFDHYVLTRHILSSSIGGQREPAVTDLCYMTRLFECTVRSGFHIDISRLAQTSIDEYYTQMTANESHRRLHYEVVWHRGCLMIDTDKQTAMVVCRYNMVNDDHSVAVPFVHTISLYDLVYNPRYLFSLQNNWQGFPQKPPPELVTHKQHWSTCYELYEPYQDTNVTVFEYTLKKRWHDLFETPCSQKSCIQTWCLHADLAELWVLASDAQHEYPRWLPLSKQPPYDQKDKISDTTRRTFLSQIFDHVRLTLGQPCRERLAHELVTLIHVQGSTFSPPLANLVVSYLSLF